MGWFAGTPTFTKEDIPDQSGKVSIVTGGNSGIGRETCLALLAKGGRVYMASRNQEKAEISIEVIKKIVADADVHWLKLDLADISSVKDAADEFLRKETKLHTLYNNAGILATPFSLTKDGYEIQWGTNVVGHFALTKFLLPLLLDTAAKSPSGTVRVINTSSCGHILARSINFSDLKLESSFAMTRYTQSKLGNILMSNEIARRYGNKGIVSISLHPGTVDTNIMRSFDESWYYRFVSAIKNTTWLTPENGAITQLWAGTHPDAGEEGMNGKYLVPYARVCETSRVAADVELARLLWDHLDKELSVLLEIFIKKFND